MLFCCFRPCPLFRFPISGFKGGLERESETTEGAHLRAGPSTLFVFFFFFFFLALRIR